MHVLIVTDQHPDSLGGAQVAIRAQRRALERAGHRVTIVAPRLHRPGYQVSSVDRDAYIDLPSRPITADREYGMSWPGRRADRVLASALRSRPRVDLVHVQGDFWGALIGLRAARGLRVPAVHTLHNHLDEGTRAVTRLAPFVFQGLRLWRWLALGRVRGNVPPVARGAWRYLAEISAECAVVSAPSQHFADELMRHGVAPEVVVTRGGVDDDAVAAASARTSAGPGGSETGTPRHGRARPRLIWLGRMSQEKRVLEFIEAFARSAADADVTLYGAGLLVDRVRARVRELGLEGRVTLAGPVPHHEALVAIHDADALVQTSIGFETQGLTPFEAAILGTPTVFCDAAIAADVGVDPSWVVRDDSVAALAEALAEAVAQLAEARARGAELRVPAEQTRGFLQSAQAERLLEQYARALTQR